MSFLILRSGQEPLDSAGKGSTVTVCILLIDDDESLVGSVLPVLTGEGCSVHHAVPGLDAIRRMLIDEPDLVILGIDPDDGGWRFFRKLLTFLDRPLLLLLSSDDGSDRVKALQLGADDCMAKPVLLGELVARVQALLRRGVSQHSQRLPPSFSDGNLVIDLNRYQVRIGGKPVILTATEFRVLSCLVQHAGEVLPYERLMSQVWGPDHTHSPDNLRTYIYFLRQKLEADPSRPQRIVTWRGQGYMFTQPGE
jgi:DNA-binding response OmpR family regulator